MIKIIKREKARIIQEKSRATKDYRNKINEIEEEIIEVDGKKFILEKPLRADVALLLGHTVDTKGNITYNNTARNFNPIMATAADLVIVEAENIVECGSINANDVVTPRIFVDYIVGSDHNG